MPIDNVTTLTDITSVWGNDVADTINGIETTIADLPIANLADIAAARVLGRASGAGSGPPTELTAAQVGALLAQVATLNFVIDGGGSVITTGTKGVLVVDFAATITKWTLLGDVSGSIVVDVWKDTYANHPPVVGDSITAAAKPTISGATKGQSSTLTGWTTSIAAGDILRFNVDSASTVTRVTLALTLLRT